MPYSNQDMESKEEEYKMIFVASCIEAAASRLNCSSAEVYRRMKAVDLIDGYILKHYETIHSESRENITNDILECLEFWEQNKLAKS